MVSLLSSILMMVLSTSSAQRDQTSFTSLKTKNKVQQSLLSPSSYKSPSFYKKDRTLKDHYVDDDYRHTHEPSNENATNGPAENISIMPSQHPSSSRYYNSPSKGSPTSSSPTFHPSLHPSRKPSTLPSSSPSFHPSLHPSRKPSTLPSSSPSFHPSLHPSKNPSISPTQSPTTTFAPTIPHPCGRYNEYNFGIINWGNEDVVNYNYDVETDMDIANVMGITLTDEIKAIEAALLDLLIQLYFPQCSTRRQQRGLNGNLLSSYNATSSRSVIVDDHDTNELIGISSKPIDWTNGDTCEPETYGDSMSCNIMEGRLSLFYSQPLNSKLSGRFLQEPIRRLNNEEDTMLHSIKTIMDDGALNDCHPAVISVRFRNQSTTELGGNEDDDSQITNDDETGTTLISNSIMWLAIGLSISALMILVGVRYRYHRHQKSMYKEYKENQVGPGGDSSDDEFVEYEDPNWKDSNRVVASSLKMHRTQSGLSSPSNKSAFKTYSQHTYPQQERQYMSGNTNNRKVASSLKMQRNQSNQNSSTNKKPDIRTQLVQHSPKRNLAENATYLPTQLSSNINNVHESQLIETIRGETNQIKAKLEATRRSMRDLEEQHDNLRQYLELAKQEPSVESIKRARLAMLLMNPSTTSENRLKE